jgi:hypothetical protein
MTSKESLGMRHIALIPCGGFRGDPEEENTKRGHVYRILHIDNPKAKGWYLPLEKCYEIYGEKNCFLPQGETICPDCREKEKQSLKNKLRK